MPATLAALAPRRAACSTSYALAGPAAPSRAPGRAVAAPSARRATVAVVPHSSGRSDLHPDPAAPLYPGPQEEKDVSHEAFMHAMEAARPRAMRIPGMQEFAASIWERRRRIPSQTYSDPLDHIFTEFDADNDGKLSAAEVAHALVSRGVDATEEQVQMFIEASDTDADHLIARSEFPSFIFHMASADLRSVSSMATPAPPAVQIILPPRMAGPGPEV
ncbi:hypothetical protein Rsub_03394 [Raphidocelis subcapitata]|uniref:EF-hand domain-containing protein n=1 Tax=Raphidocelis subcapitata TaxID=307507 RepID=A0A2V0NRL0_9CHLO|nr:hypothetical protein Rsub_03394 [Raphidocelis subcapitata]|eukprot:GBF90261.1 hypothetical protein Rsub_03394 [Raphidocelis subcapitata]